MKTATISFFILFFSFSAFSFSGLGQDEKPVKIKLKDFEKSASTLIGKTITVTGIVDHVCKHGGKKLFLVDEHSDARVKITTGENMAAFTQDLIGETIEITGVVEEQRIDEEYLTEMENKLQSGVKQKGDGLHLKNEGSHDDHEKNENQDQLQKIKLLKDQLKKSGKDHLSFFSIKATGYKKAEE